MRHASLGAAKTSAPANLTAPTPYKAPIPMSQLKQVFSLRGGMEDDQGERAKRTSLLEDEHISKRSEAKRAAIEAKRAASEAKRAAIEAKRASHNYFGAAGSLRSQAFRKTSILAMDLAKWLQTLWQHPLLN